MQWQKEQRTTSCCNAYTHRWSRGAFPACMQLRRFIRCVRWEKRNTIAQSGSPRIDRNSNSV
jgi:hypothetical protein